MTAPDSSPAGDAQRPEPETASPAVKPSLRTRLRPLELLGISAGLGVFAGLVTLITLRPKDTQDWLLVLIVFGAGFILTLITLAMLALGGYEPPKEPPTRVLQPPDEPHRPGRH